MARGRKSKVDRGELVKVMLRYKYEIVTCESTIIQKTAPVWTLISEELNGLIKPNSLHALACDKSQEIRCMLLGSSHDHTGISSFNISNVTSEERNPVNEAEYSTGYQESGGLRNFRISFTKNEFASLVTIKTEKKGVHVRFKDGGMWGDAIAHKIWTQTPISCGYQFKSHYLSQDASSGKIDGYCKCGSTLKGLLTNNENNISINCSASVGEKQCGKRNLRGAKRMEVAEMLKHTSAEAFRAQEAKRLMEPGRPEAPFLFKANVLHKAKHDKTTREYLDPDPIRALDILKSLKPNTIHKIGHNPFDVFYMTSHQLNIYKRLTKTEKVTLCIDASGVRVPKLRRPDGTLSHDIFLYISVINCDAGQFSISQFLSEAHSTVSIRTWLMNMCMIGAPHPKEVVTDGSRALLTAAIREYTEYFTIEDYADGYKSKLPKCYVRIDVAHFIKNYSTELKKCSKPIRTLLLAAVGQLIMCRNVKDAEKIFKALLTVTQCETEGQISGTEESTECEKQLNFLIHKSTGAGNILKDHDATEEDYGVKEGVISDNKHGISENLIRSNWWFAWAKQINDQVALFTSESGTKANAYYLPNFSNRLLRDSSTIPLWSNIFRNEFDYGRVPASSASVEGEFNKIKTHIIPDSLRVDKFVEKHIDYLTGRILIAEANLQKPITGEHDNLQTTLPNEVKSSPANSIDKHLGTASSDSHYGDPGEFSLKDPDEVKSSPASSIGQHQGTASSDSHYEDTGEFSLKDSDEVKSSPASSIGQHLGTTNSDLHYGNPGEFLPEDSDTSKVLNISNNEMDVPIENTIATKPKRVFSQVYSDSESELNPEVAASREIENWRGKGGVCKKQRVGKYLGQRQDEVADALYSKIQEKTETKKSKSIPFLKNGNSCKLQPTMIQKKLTTVYNTCAFDSLCQSLVIASIDFWKIKQFITAQSQIPFLNLVKDIISAGVTSKTYSQRGEISSEFCKTTSEENSGLHFMNCTTTPGFVLAKTLQECPSIVHELTCSAKCSPRKRAINALLLNDEIMMETNFDRAFADAIEVMPRFLKRCSHCFSVTTAKVSEAGPIVFIELFNARNMGRSFRLNALPQQFKVTVKEQIKEFTLQSIIHYIGNRPTRSSEESSGHFTAYCKRPNKTWIMYDDLRERGEKKGSNTLVEPQLLIYVLTE